MEKLTKEQIEQLKTQHGNIYEASIVYRNPEGKKKEIQFIHREPSFAEYEMLQKEVAGSGPLIAMQNLVASVIVHPKAAAISSMFSECPIALDRWFTKAILPFFGGDVLETQSLKL